MPCSGPRSTPFARSLSAASAAARALSASTRMNAFVHGFCRSIALTPASTSSLAVTAPDRSPTAAAPIVSKAMCTEQELVRRGFLQRRVERDGELLVPLRSAERLDDAHLFARGVAHA